MPATIMFMMRTQARALASTMSVATPVPLRSFSPYLAVMLTSPSASSPRVTA